MHKDIPTMTLCSQLTLPPAPVVLMLPAHEHNPSLQAPRKTRNAAEPYDYYTLPLLLRAEQHHGVWHKLVVSYAAPVQPGQRAKHGRIILTKRFTPISVNPLIASEPIPAAVIQATLDNAIPTRFLPALFEQVPALKSSNLPFGLIGRYAYHQLVDAETGLTKKYKATRQKTFSELLKLWADRPLNMITPVFCGAGLLTMSPAAAKDSVRLLRKLFALSLGILMPDPEIWDHYSLSAFRTQYDPQRIVRNSLINLPWPPTNNDIATQRCLDGMADPRYGGHYLVALAILNEGLEIEEGCALTAGSLSVVAEYAGRYQMAITHVVRPRGDHVGSRKRRKQHERVPITDPHQRRKIGVSDKLAKAWLDYRANHPALADDTLLLHNPKNAERVMPINTYEKWLDDHFDDLAPAPIEHCDQVIAATYRAADHMIDTAAQTLIASGYNEAELRYHQGLKPQTMAARHYTGYNCPAEQAKMGALQDTLEVQNNGSQPTPKNHRQRIAEGKPLAVTTLRCVIVIPPGITLTSNLIIKVSARFGQNISAVVKGGLYGK